MQATTVDSGVLADETALPCGMATDRAAKMTAVMEMVLVNFILAVVGFV